MQPGCKIYHARCKKCGGKQPLRLILGPSLLPARALEHADCAAILGIEHTPKQRGLLAATRARPNRIGSEAGKDFVFEFVVHVTARVMGNSSYKVNIRS